MRQKPFVLSLASMGGASTTATADFSFVQERAKGKTADFCCYGEGVEEAGDGRMARTGTCPI
jgi:hypothetical protein